MVIRFEVAGERGLGMKWWNLSSLSELLSLVYLLLFVHFFTSPVGCILRGDMLSFHIYQMSMKQCKSAFS